VNRAGVVPVRMRAGIESAAAGIRVRSDMCVSRDGQSLCSGDAVLQPPVGELSTQPVDNSADSVWGFVPKAIVQALSALWWNRLFHCPKGNIKEVMSLLIELHEDVMTYYKFTLANL